MSTIKKSLIFDMDGTLIDSSEVICNSINYVREKLALPPLKRENILHAVNDMQTNSPHYFYEAKEFEEKHIRWFQEYYTHFFDKEVRLYDGVKPLLEKAKKRYNISLATNAYRQSALQILSHVEIEGDFEIIVCADDVRHSKPHPEMIEKILTHFNHHPNEAYMIGDSLKDKEAASRAGVETILVDWGFSDLQQACKEVGELEEILGV
jgi:phosphoglycolate phosphatase